MREKAKLWLAALLYAAILASIPAAIIWLLNSR